MNIDKLFEENNKNHFSFVTLFTKNVNRLLKDYIKEEFKDKVNLVIVDQDKLTKEEIDIIADKSQVCISNDPSMLEIFKNNKNLLYQIVFDYNVDAFYPSNIDFFDPLRNDTDKTYKPRLNKSLVHDFKWFLRANRIDYVNY